MFAGVGVAEDDSTHYSFKTIDIPLPGASATTALGINSEGFIVGRYLIGAALHGYLLTDNGLTIIDDPDILPTAPVTYANGVNPKGDVVGYYLDPPPGTELSTPVKGQMGMDFDMTGDPPPAAKLRGYLRSPSGVFTPIDFPASQVPPAIPRTATSKQCR